MIFYKTVSDDYVNCYDISHNKLEIIVSIVYLSYDVAIIQWITSYHKNHMTTRVVTLLRLRNVIDKGRVNNAFSC